jgi:hypothetical protein
MRVILTFLFIIGLSGCIAYPSKHVSLAEQRFTFKNASQLNAAMYIGVDQTEQCKKHPNCIEQVMISFFLQNILG